MYNEKLEALIEAALEDGVLTEKEKQVLFKNAQAMGIDLDEFEMVLDARLAKMQKEEKAKAQAAAPKSNKFGDIKKCPNCGAMVQSYQGKCPECGYAFEGIEANSATKELSKLLQQANDHKQMIKVIETFPIPMDKAVLIDFISWLKPQCLDVKNPLSKSYSKKYDECIQKARITFSNDKELTPLIAEYDSVQKQIKKVKHIENLKWLLKKWWFWVALVIVLIIAAISISSHLSSNRQEEAATAIRNNDLTTAYNIMMKDDDIKEDLADSYIKKCLELNEIDMAESLYNDMESISKYSFSSRWDKKKCRGYIYDYLLQNKNYEKAEKYTEFYSKSDPYSRSFVKEHYAFIIDVANSMCKEGLKKEARNYTTGLIEKYEWHDKSYFGGDEKRYKADQYTKDAVTKSVKEVIDKY